MTSGGEAALSRLADLVAPARLGTPGRGRSPEPGEFALDTHRDEA